MKEQVLRILKMVQEGRLSPDDAYDLMDAFTNFESAEQNPPPPPKAEPVNGKAEEPFRSFVDRIEKMTKEAVQGVDWSRVATEVRSAARRGAATLRESVEHLGKGDFKFSWFGPAEEKVVELPLNIKSGKTLRLERTNGDVDIKGGADEAKVVVKAKVRGRDREDARLKAEAFTPVIEEHDGSLVIRQSSEAVEERLDVQIPNDVNLDIRIESGDVRIRDTNGSLRLEAKSGDIDAQDLKGTIEITTAAGDVDVKRSESSLCEIENKSGDVTIQSLKGNLMVRSASGDVRCREMDGSAISIETVSGDIDLDVAQPMNGAINIRTVSGDVLMDLASGSSCRVTLSSVNGSVSSRIDLEDEKRTEERITGIIGSGEGSIDASAVSGDIRLSWREHQ